MESSRTEVACTHAHREHNTWSPGVLMTSDSNCLHGIASSHGLELPATRRCSSVQGVGIAVWLSSSSPSFILAPHLFNYSNAKVSEGVSPAGEVGYWFLVSQSAGVRCRSGVRCRAGVRSGRCGGGSAFPQRTVGGIACTR